MIELYLSKVTENSESEQAGKLYARVSYKQAMDIHDMAHHMAEHNTAFSEGLIVRVHFTKSVSTPTIKPSEKAVLCSAM